MDDATELPTDPAELTRLLESVDAAEAPELVERIVEALEAALAGDASTER
jgi:Lon protease-like protein